jgi:hypothetical protein
MNKAFVREPDDTGVGHCPKCGSLGTDVVRATMSEHVAPEAVQQLSESAFFCPFPRCEVVYFDRFDRVAAIASLRHPVWPKDAAAPLCGCFGLTAEDIDADVDEGAPRRVRELLAKSKTDQARCAILSASGRCCMPEVQRYYMKHRQDTG